MPIRIAVQSIEPSLRVTLDIPSLVMAWEPIPATQAAGGVELHFPFGLGGLTVDLTGERTRAEKAIGGDRLELSLQRAGMLPFTRRDVRFSSGEAELAGTLLVPRGEGPHPAVVLLHGSGRQDTWGYRSWADLFVRQGLAVLYYDKRGVGASGGNFGAGLRRLADDGRAAVEYLRTQPEVDRGRIGLKGSSQGAWLAEQIASDLGDIAFLILVSAAAGTPRLQELQRIEHGMRADGLSEMEIESALAYAGLYFYVARTGDGWPLLAKAVLRAQNQDWGQYVDQPTSEADLAWWRENHSFQPAEVAKNLDLPVLLLYGGADWVTPPVENAAKLRSLFRQPERVEIHVFAGADHRLEVDAGRDPAGVWHWPRKVPGMRRIVAEWLAKQ